MEREKGEVNGVIDLLVRQAFFFLDPQNCASLLRLAPFPIKRVRYRYEEG